MVETLDEKAPSRATIDALKAMRDKLAEMERKAIEAAKVAELDTRPQQEKDNNGKSGDDTVTKAAKAAIAIDMSRAVIGSKQVQEAMGAVAEVFNRNSFAASIIKGLASLDTEVFNKSLASLGNVGAADMSKAPETVQKAIREAQEKLAAANTLEVT